MPPARRKSTRSARLTEAQRRELWDLMTIPEREEHLRANATSSEIILYDLLSAEPLLASKFRFQAHCCGFYADFLFLAPAKLIVELDGAVHRTARAKIDDARRTRELSRAGYRVVRFWNGKVRTEPAAVMNKILMELGLASEIQVVPARPLSLEDIFVTTRARTRPRLPEAQS